MPFKKRPEVQIQEERRELVRLLGEFFESENVCGILPRLTRAGRVTSIVAEATSERLKSMLQPSINELRMKQNQRDSTSTLELTSRDSITKALDELSTATATATDDPDAFQSLAKQLGVEVPQRRSGMRRGLATAHRSLSLPRASKAAAAAGGGSSSTDAASSSSEAPAEQPQTRGAAMLAATTAVVSGMPAADLEALGASLPPEALVSLLAGHARQHESVAALGAALSPPQHAELARAALASETARTALLGPAPKQRPETSSQEALAAVLAGMPHVANADLQTLLGGLGKELLPKGQSHLLQRLVIAVKRLDIDIEYCHTSPKITGSLLASDSLLTCDYCNNWEYMGKK